MPDRRAMQCSNCGATDPGDARFCGTCGHQLAQASPAGVEEQPLPGHCGHCGAAAAPGVAACAHCGRPRDFPQGVLSVSGERHGSLPRRELADLLAETWRQYRRRWPLFAGLGFIPQLPGLAALAAPGLATDLILAFFGLVLLAVSQGATVYAVVGHYLGLPVSLSRCLGRARPKAFALITCLIALGVVLVLSSLLIAVLIGIPLLFFALVLLWFYPQGIMVESLGPVNALRRSSSLVRGNWWRVFGIGVSFALPVAVATVIVAVTLGDPTRDTASGIVTALLSAVTMPWLMIGSTLVYLDLRLRKEALSLETLGRELGTSGDDQVP